MDTLNSFRSVDSMIEIEAPHLQRQGKFHSIRNIVGTIDWSLHILNQVNGLVREDTDYFNNGIKELKDTLAKSKKLSKNNL